MSDLTQIAPHGGTLINLLVEGDAASALVAEAANLPTLVVGERELSDLEMLAVGALSPLTGFQGKADYDAVLDRMHLANGLPWAIPVVLSVSEDEAHRIGGASAVALAPSEGADPIAVLRVSGTFKRDKQKEATSVYGTDDGEHPGVAAVYAAGDICVAGTLEVISLPAHDDFQSYRLTPAQTRAEFAKRGWRTVVGFQTRTRSTVPMNTSRSARWRSPTDSWFTRWSVPPRPTTCRRMCGCSATRRSSRVTTPGTAPW